jgi:hypothetical protein
LDAGNLQPSWDWGPWATEPEILLKIEENKCIQHFKLIDSTQFLLPGARGNDLVVAHDRCWIALKVANEIRSSRCFLRVDIEIRETFVFVSGFSNWVKTRFGKSFFSMVA